MCSKTPATSSDTLARLTLQRAQAQWRELDEHIAWCDERIAAHARDNPEVKQAATLMGIGPVDGVRRRGHRRRLQAVQERRAVRRLDRPDAAPALQRRQEQPGRHHQARRHLPAHYRMLGDRGQVINYRHIIHSLVRNQRYSKLSVQRRIVSN